MLKRFSYELLNNLHDAAYCVNGHGVITFWNKSAEVLTGVSPNSAKGKNCSDILTYEDENGVRVSLSDYPAFVCLQSSSEIIKNHYLIAGNEKFYVEECVSPILKKDKITGAISIIRDNSRVFPVLEEHISRRRQERFIPICAWCKKIKIAGESWEQIEKYLTDDGFGVFTHGMCPDCADKIFEKKVYLESYQNICKAISSSLSLNEVLNLIVTNAVKVMNVKASMLRLLNKETHKLEVAAAYGLSEKYISKGPVDYDKSIEDALSGKAVSTYDITSDSNAKYRAEAEKEGIRSILSIPVKSNKEIIGILRMYTSEPVKYKDEDLKFMAAIAEQAAIAIINAKTFETTVSRAKQYLKVFEEVTKAVSSTLRLNEVLNLIVSKLPEVMNLKAATIRLLDESGKKLELAAAYGLSEKYLARGPVDLEENIKEALQTRPAAIYDVATDSRIHYQKEALEEGIKSMLTLPIIAKGKVIGVLRLLTDRHRHFSDEDVAFSASLAEVCGTAIENARMYEQLTT
jgi:PAS domain S-box-containing protein